MAMLVADAKSRRSLETKENRMANNDREGKVVLER
jgi:hypothetical protein